MAITRQKVRALLEDNYRFTGGFTLSSGGKSEIYVDCRAAMLRHPRMFRRFLDDELEKLGWPQPIATGAGGAIMLATVGAGYLWNPKGHGREWSPQPKEREEVALFDDVKTTGGTLARLRGAAERAGLKVVGEVVLYDRSDPIHAKAVYLASPYSSPIFGVAEKRFESILDAVAKFQTMGEMVYSPVAHCHPVAMKHTLPTDFAFWQHLNRVFIAKLDEVWILALDGWEHSAGIRGEVEYARSIGKPVWVVDPESLTREPLDPGELL